MAINTPYPKDFKDAKEFKKEFLASVGELYREWCKHEDVVKLPDFEEAMAFVKEHGLTN